MNAVDRRWLAAGVLFFIVIKLVSVILPIFVMGMPRTGDDALVYLWLGESTVFTSHEHTPGVQAIGELHARNDAPDAELAHQRDRASVHVTSVNASPYSLVTWLLLQTKWEHAVLWSILESLVALTLAYGAARFLFALFGARAAALGLVFLAFLILPEQGIHLLVPGVFALALALIAWARAIEGKADWRQTLLCLALCLVHPISYAYTAMAAAMAFAIPTAREKRIVFEWRAPLWSLAGAVVAPLLAGALGAHPARSDIAASLDLASLGANALATLNFFFDAVEDAPLLTLAAIAGAIVGARRRTLTWVHALVAAVLIGALCATPFVAIPGYPGAVGARVQAGLAIFAAGLAGLAALALFERPRWGAVLGGSVAALIAVSLMPAAHKAALANINNRYDILDSRQIRQTLAALPPDEPIVWLEPDTIMMAAFVEGAWRRPAIPYAAAGGAMDDVLRGRSSILIGTRAPLWLNSRAALWDRSLRPRFYGYSFADVSTVRISRVGAPLGQAHVRLAGENAPIDVDLLRDGAPCGRGTLPTAQGAWRRIDASACPDADAAVLRAPEEDTQVTGLAIGMPTSVADWPWDVEGVSMEAQPRRDERSLRVAFGLSALLAEAKAEPFAQRLGAARVVSDRGGLVLLRAEVR